MSFKNQRSYIPDYKEYIEDLQKTKKELLGLICNEIEISEIAVILIFGLLLAKQKPR